MADITSPVLTALTLPGTLDLTSGAVQTTFSASAADAESGIKEVDIWLDRPFTDNIGTFPLVGLFDFVDSWSDGISAANRTVSQYAGPGRYTVTHIDLTDNAGNVSSLSTSALAAAGFATTFTLLNGDYHPTAGNDVLGGSSLSDVLLGQEGNDRITAYGGSDVIYGNAGADLAYGNEGADTIFGGQGSDILLGGQGVDVVYGNMGDDIIYGNFGNDLLSGGRGADILYGGQGADVLNGNLGNDVLIGGAGADQYVFGRNSGTDVIRGFNQGAGDRLDFQGQTYTKADSGGSAVLMLSGGGTVTIEGVSSASVSASSFAYSDPTNAFSFS